ncbi:hypothetical protein F5Y08DRAFT_337623 [Xylaria arbuscula]|nr:hypothetical protein F5Y08DRAFT_337623 [Xylaria arbuscula]
MPEGLRIRPSKYLIPSRSSRHRIACLALYRALLRLAPKISLPDDLATGWGPGKNPIAIHIQKAFRRNVGDTSPRIVYPALGAGYRMLSVLHNAATSPKSEHRTSILALLQSRLEERRRSLANRTAPRPISYDPKSDRPHPGTLPLLVKVSPPPSRFNPDPKPLYATPHRPLPQAELGGTGRRKVPHMDMAGDIPFLRLTKPQPAVLSRVLNQKVRKRATRIIKMTELQNDGLPTAKLEDQWDAEIMRRVQQERGSRGNSRSMAFKPVSEQDEPTHTHVLKRHGIQEMAEILTRERQNDVARADAMRLLVKQEKALAEQEKAQRDAERRARWEAKMLELHGEGWRDRFPHLKDSEASPVH